MKKILCSTAIIFIFVFVLTGCAKCINTETSTVQVKVVDEYYRACWIQAVYTGKIITAINHPAIYRITVEYNNVEYNISGRYAYDKYSDRIGEYANGILETKKYDDGTVSYDIIGLE